MRCSLPSLINIVLKNGATYKWCLCEKPVKIWKTNSKIGEGGHMEKNCNHLWVWAAACIVDSVTNMAAWKSCKILHFSDEIMVYRFQDDSLYTYVTSYFATLHQTPCDQNHSLLTNSMQCRCWWQGSMMIEISELMCVSWVFVMTSLSTFVNRLHTVSTSVDTRVKDHTRIDNYWEKQSLNMLGLFCWSTNLASPAKVACDITLCKTWTQSVSI